MRWLIRWALVIAAVVTAAYFLTAGAETRSTRASVPRVAGTAIDDSVPIARGAPSFADAASRGVQELLSGDRTVAWNPRTGLWGGHSRPNWWQSALALQTLVRYLERTHSVSPLYQHVITRIYQRNVYKPLSTAKRDFANEFMDDTAWWGLAWLEASRYELYYRHDRADAAKFLAVAEYDVRYIVAAPRQCGGIVWALRRAPDMVTSAEFVALAAKLASYREAPGVFHDARLAAAWRTDANYVFGWLRHSGMVDLRMGYVLDRIDGGCHSFTGGPLTYTEGEMADALVQLGTALHKPMYFRLASRFIRYVLNYKSRLITPRGVLQERCEPLSGSCRTRRTRLDIPAYKGIFIQAVADWTAATRKSTFVRFLRNQAAAVVDNAIVNQDNQPATCSTTTSCRFAFIWTRQIPGDPPVPVTVASQQSALDALTAALPVKSSTS